MPKTDGAGAPLLATPMVPKMNSLLEALQKAERAFLAEVARTSDLSNQFEEDDAERLAWLAETYELAKRVYLESITEGMNTIPQA